MNAIEELATYLNDKPNVWLYGAGRMAKRVILFCKQKGIKINGIIVTERVGNPYAVDGIKVYTLDELKYKGIKHNTLNVLVSFNASKHNIFDDFINLGFASLMFLTPNMCRELSFLELQLHYNDLQDDVRLDATSEEFEPTQGVLYDKGNDPFLRFPAGYKGIIEALMKFGNRGCTIEALGNWENLPHTKNERISEEVGLKNKIETYVVTSHHDNMVLCDNDKKSKVYIPLQVGAYYSPTKKCEVSDNTGINISEKNKDYSECTGLYWIWKNTKGQRYVGLNHYRRRLMIDNESVQYITKNNIDVVVGLPQLEVLSMKGFFLEHYISKFDWNMFEAAFEEYKPEWLNWFKKFEEGHFYFPCNVCLWKRDWFDQYSEFAFNIAKIVERENDIRGLYRNDRYMGYLFECMATIFIMANNYNLNVACTEIEWVG